MKQTLLMRRLGMSVPVIQAPMAGGAVTADLVVAVSDAGGLGFLAAAYSTPAQIADMSKEVRSRTGRPFGINLFAPQPAVPAPPADAALAALAGPHRQLGLPPPSLPDHVQEDFDEQFAAAMDSGAAVLSFTFGLLPESAMETARNRGMVLIGTATTVDEAVLLEQAGVDAVVAQGSEAGAHRGTFASPFDEAMVGTMALVPQVADRVGIPVIASGGIMDGRGVVAALALGAKAVQMGTAFLTTAESGIPDVYRRSLHDTPAHRTRLTRAFSGRPSRGIINEFMEQAEALPDAVLPYPHQNALTRPMRSAAAAQGRPDFLSLWAGQGLPLGREVSAAELVRSLADEMKSVATSVAN